MNDINRRDFIWKVTLLLLLNPVKIIAEESNNNDIPRPVIISIKIISDKEIDEKTSRLRQEWEKEIEKDNNKLSDEELEKEREAVSKALKEMLKSKGVDVEK